ncbi:MAG: phosphoglucosamine mutase [Proteobacteria bacterium]|nr:phosphoglucosamine mutase [Pseudomonadota bacterium]
MMRKYFGTDGIRGRAGKYPITVDFFTKLGFAAGKVLTNHKELTVKPKVIIGKDTRVSGYMLESALEAGFSAAGVDVYLTGPIPTPAIAYLTKTLRAQIGVVISASHNLYHDNGIKFFSSQGLKLDDQIELEIEKTIDSIENLDSETIGKAKRIDDAQGRYLEFCKNTFSKNLSLSGVKIVLDCSHGATYQVAPKLFSELGADVLSIGIQPNGTNINEHCGSTSLDLLSLTVKESKAHLGIAFDGDGDRVLMVNSKGEKVDGDQLLFIIVRAAMTHKTFSGGVIGTLMTNLALEEKFKKLNIDFQRSDVGDRYVSELMQANNWKYGGENSGHILLKDFHTTGDGIISALQVLQAIQERQLSFDMAVEEIKLYPQVLFNVPLENDVDLESQEIKQSILQAERIMNQDGRVLLRKSGTEAVIRIMTEAKNKELAIKAAECIQQIILKKH